jgi:RNA polymerase sigma-70 factor, ECF subfamily
LHGIARNREPECRRLDTYLASRAFDPMSPPTATQLDDVEIVVPAPADDLGAVFRQHSGYVAAVAFRLLGRDQEIDDVVQEVFLVATRHLRKLREPAAIKGWLATVAVRVVRRKLRARKVRAFFGAELLPDYSAVVVDASQEQALIITRAYQVLDQLPVDEKIAWMLRHAEGERLETVAALCECSLATAKRRIAAAQYALGEELS